MYILLWEFRPRPGRERDFEAAYGPEGTWSRFFRGGAGYLGTELLRDEGGAGRYVTADRWVSREAYEAFRRDRFAEYEALDRRLEALTASESTLGAFESVEPAGDLP